MTFVSIFSRIADIIFPPTAEERIVRSLTNDELFSLFSITPLQNGFSLLPYRDTRVRALIHRAKYAKDLKAFDFLANILSLYLATYSEPLTIIPIPLSKRRLHDRGYNQCVEIALRALQNSAHKLDTELLARTRDTPPQTHLQKKERLTNMIGAFEVPSGSRENVMSRRFVVIDDVTTTGATLREARRALLNAGAREVVVVALAH